MKRNAINRRHFLKGAGTIVSLPLLSAMSPAYAASGTTKEPHRFVAICGDLGFHTPYLFPEQTGKNYQLTPYLQPLAAHRNEMTVISGLSHPEQNGNNGHASGMTWLTSAMRPGLAGFRNTVSLDQLMAHHLGGTTRFPYLCLSNGGGSLSWTAGGVGIPSESSPSKLFAKMFISGNEREVKNELRELERGRSILDTVLYDANKLDRSLGAKDRHKLDEYLTSVRDLEVRIGQSESWAKRPKPAVDYAPPQDVADKVDILAKQRLMYDMMALALQTDSSRVMTYALGGLNAVPSNIPGVKTDWHNLSHHGKDDAKIEELKIIEEHEFIVFNEFLNKLKAVDEQGKTLLDNTSILFGSNLGNASSHDWHNLPIIVAGGGYRHGAYVAHDEKNNTPFANLFVTFAQRMGLEMDQFGSSTAAGIRGLEIS
ncbi:DUF1552 domain-containing protein [Rubinisphaera italica]|uniref:DUF1552 domain-containing protein n=1 Tax=Rubinisphaera italica TaxID=2527969 RepID=A0A5C5XHA8_9PLAN|nr:DUF1552 domain-containing protein [Rubinisphaera italica]TWT62068.1 hypothetical protein Pan54_28070 [Rubinisphaera italica]